MKFAMKTIFTIERFY